MIVIVDKDLLVNVGAKSLMLFVLDDLDDAVPEVQKAASARDALRAAARKLDGRVREVKASRLVTDNERATMRVRAFDEFDAALRAGREVLGKIEAAVSEREAALRPSHRPIFETGDATTAVDLQLAAMVAAFDGDRRRAFAVQLAAGEPLAVRCAEALLRVGSLAGIEPQWLDEIRRELLAFRNADLLDGLRQAKIAAGRLSRTLEELERASAAESTLDRHAVGQVQSTALAS